MTESIPIDVLQTAVFADWLAGLRDRRAQTKIVSRIDRAAFGLFGDHKRFDGLLELRIDHGPGYRLYAVQRDKALVILLCGGEKGSQRRDITRAKALAADVDRDRAKE